MAEHGAIASAEDRGPQPRLARRQTAEDGVDTPEEPLPAPTLEAFEDDLIAYACGEQLPTRNGTRLPACNLIDLGRNVVAHFATVTRSTDIFMIAKSFV
jgi:hypothetical protein